MSAYGKQANGLEDPRDILGVGAVKAQRRQTQAADNKERVGHIVAKDPWQEQRKAGEQRLPLCAMSLSLRTKRSITYDGD